MELPSALVPALADLARRAGAHRLVLFGSRARGDCRERSDIDLAVYGLPRDVAGRLRLELEELPTPKGHLNAKSPIRTIALMGLSSTY